MESDNMKILITSPRNQKGGVASFVENIFPYFNNKAKLFYRGKKPKKGNKLNAIFDNLFMPLRFFLSLVNNRPERIIINTSLSLALLIRDGILVLISKHFNKKVLLIIHGFQENVLKYQFLLKYGYFRSDAIIVLSKSFAEKLKQKGYKNPIYTKWNPVSDKIITACESKSIDLAGKEKLKILFLSRIERDKGIFTAIDAFKQVQKKHSNVFLKIGGTGKVLEDAKHYVNEKEIKNIEFLGYVKDKEKTELLKSSDIFLFPTEWKEGLPINVLEAMTAGQIIITRPVGGLVDLYEECNFGFSIYSTKPEDFAEVIVKILENKTKFTKIAEHNADFARKNFHPKIITEKIKRILESL